MAASSVSYLGNGSTQSFALTFNYIAEAHVQVFVDGVEDTTFTWVDSSNILLTSIPITDAVVLIKRTTPTEPIVDFTDGANLTETLLDNATRQPLYVVEESSDTSNNSLTLDETTNTYDAQSRRIKNLSDPVDVGDAISKGYLDDNYTNAIDAAVISTAADAASASTSADEAEASAILALSGTAQGATGGGDDEVFILSSIAVTEDYTIPTGKTAISGDVIIADGKTITVSDGAAWKVV